MFSRWMKWTMGTLFLTVAAAAAQAAGWQPNGGSRQAAPNGTYVGHVTITVSGQTTTVRLTTAEPGPDGHDGTLTLGKDEFTATQWEAVEKALRQNDRDNWVRIENGKVTGVGTGKPIPQ